MTGFCERCHESHSLFSMGGRHYCVTCYSDRRRRLTASYRGPERRYPATPNPARWSRRWDDIPEI